MTCTSVQDRSKMFDNLSSDFLMASSYRARLFTQLRRRLQKSLARKPLLNRELLSWQPRIFCDHFTCLSTVHRKSYVVIGRWDHIVFSEFYSLHHFRKSRYLETRRRAFFVASFVTQWAVLKLNIPLETKFTVEDGYHFRIFIFCVKIEIIYIFYLHLVIDSTSFV